jgi:hypothetical protein
VRGIEVNTETALEPISLARQALAEATTLPDMKSVRSWAEALRAYAKSRGMGIDAENQAAEVVICAERKMGAELKRMVEAGERRTHNTPFAGRKPSGELILGDREVGLEDLGVTVIQSRDWRRLATIPDEGWDAVVADAYANGERLSRMNFIRAYFGPNQKRDALRDDVDEWTEGWAKMVAGSALLGAALDQGWPVQSDRTVRGWGEVNDQVTAVGRNLLLFQKRVAAHMAALGVCSTADMTPGQPLD